MIHYLRRKTKNDLSNIWNAFPETNVLLTLWAYYETLQFVIKICLKFNRSSLTEHPVLNWFLWLNKACCWLLTLWISQVVRPFQTSSSAFSVPGLSWQNDFCLSDTLCRCPMVSLDICLVRPSIGPSVFLQFLGVLVVGYITDTLASWDSIGVRWPGLQTGLGTWEWG